MAATYRDRLNAMETLVARAANERERRAFQEIAAILRRLAATETAAEGVRAY